MPFINRSQLILFPCKPETLHIQAIINTSAAIEKMASLLKQNLLALEGSVQTCPAKPALSEGNRKQDCMGPIRYYIKSIKQIKLEGRKLSDIV